MAESTDLKGPDLTQGVALGELGEGAMLQGHVKGEAVLVARRGGSYFAIGNTCTHYGGSLADGIVVDDTVRCPLHFACFSLRTGEALRAPALDPVASWKVEIEGDRLYVRKKRPIARGRHGAGRKAATPDRILIIGGGAAGNAAAEMLRRLGHGGSITVLSADTSLPYDRPNLSKEYLAGEAQEEWIPLRSAEFYRDHGIEMVLEARVGAIDPSAREVTLGDGSRRGYDALLLATGATPRRLDVAGADERQIHYLRTLDDCRALIARAKTARRAVIIGASFIGMEAAAALRQRGLEVHVVAPDAQPMAKVLGPEIGEELKRLHTNHGVVFHLAQGVAALDEGAVRLKDGTSLAADLVLAGIGVRPVIELAEQAGLAIDRGVLVDKYLATSIPGIYAAGDIARWPDGLTGETIRVEHWIVAERQGQAAARNMLGRHEPFASAPVFWTRQLGVQVSYVGHAERWDRIAVEGSVRDHDCRLAFERGGKTLAVATIGRDKAKLEAEHAFETAICASV